jgi:hypothetical protein
MVRWAALLLIGLWGTAAGAEEPPGLLSPEPSAALKETPPAVATGAPQAGDGPAFSVVRFAAGTVEFAVPQDWTVKQVPLSREVRIVAGPGDVPDDPGRLERGLWMAYHPAAPTLRGASAPARPTLADELRGRLPKQAEPTPA